MELWRKDEGKSDLHTNEKILWFDIAMNHMLLVTIIQSFSEIFDVPETTWELKKNEESRSYFAVTASENLTFVVKTL